MMNNTGRPTVTMSLLYNITISCLFWSLVLFVEDSHAFPSLIVRNRSFGRINHNKEHRGTTTATVLALASQDNNGIRLNKCLKGTHSRRQADALIVEGRVRVNGEVGFPGQRVQPNQDIITLDGTPVDQWEELNTFHDNDDDDAGDAGADMKKFTYIKYWKPRGVTCTTDISIPSNIIHAIQQSPRCTNAQKKLQCKHRIFPVGRLDKDSTGLILLTSDGRLPNAISRSIYKRPKVYKVRVNKKVTQDHLHQLRDGVVITTIAQRDQKQKPLTAKTLPCPVELFGPREFTITLMEGRNRQIRKMCAALGYTVQDLHRVEINDITLQRLKPATWDYLSTSEMKIIQSILQSYDPSNSSQTKRNTYTQ